VILSCLELHSSVQVRNLVFALGWFWGILSVGSGRAGEKSVFLNFSINKALPGTTYSIGDRYGRTIFGYGKGLSDRRER
jgi:hypothetical protein